MPQGAADGFGGFFGLRDATVHQPRRGAANPQDSDATEQFPDSFTYKGLCIAVLCIFQQFQQIRQMFGEFLMILAVADHTKHRALDPYLLCLAEASRLH